MKQIIENKKNIDVTAELIKAVKLYFGIALLVLIATIPTKAIYLLASYLWNLF